MHRFIPRIVGAARLSVLTYEEVEADSTATPQALLVVALSSISAGLGVLRLGDGRPGVLIFVSVLAFAGWAVWALLTLQIGAGLLREPETKTDIGELLRTTGFASAPGLLRIFALIPGTTAAVFAITTVWMLFAMIVAIRQALDYRSTARVIAVCAIGWLLAILMVVIIGLLFGPALS